MTAAVKAAITAVTRARTRDSARLTAGAIGLPNQSRRRRSPAHGLILATSAGFEQGRKL